MKRNTKCYNSGKIGGLMRYQYRRNFLHAGMRIIRMGYDPVNPLCNGLGEDYPYWLNMAADILMLLRCRAIYLQRNWKLSRGARIEYKIAILMNMEIMFE